MIKNLTQTMITMLMLGVFLLLSMIAVAQSVPPEIPAAEGGSKDSGQHHSNKHKDGHSDHKPEGSSDSKQPSSSENPTDSSGARPNGPSNADKNNPAGGTGGMKQY